MDIRASGRRLKSIEPVWWLIAGIATAAAVLYLAWIRHFDPILGADVSWWWALGLMVFVTERWPVELEFRRSAHSFSLSDVPLTLALVFTSGTHAFVAVMAGALVALLLRRVSGVKFAFNLAQFALVTSVLLVIVHAAASVDSGFGWITWAAVLAAAQVGSVLTTAQILAAIVLTEGKVAGSQVRQMFGLDHLVALLGTALALVGCIVWIERPEATPLLLIPILITFVGYRAYIHEREGHEKVKALYKANRTLSESPEVAVALEGLLERALEAFHAEQAEVILFPVDGSVPLRTSLGPGTAREAMAPLDAAAAVAVRSRAADSDAAVALLAPFPAALDPYLQYRGVRHGMLGVLRRHERVIGTIMVANRFGLSRGFTKGDRALFGTLAANASAALQYDRLEHAVSELQVLQDQLQHQAHHDPLTGLATRSLFSQQVREALEPGTQGEAAVMIIDLDDFKGVNDTFGHSIGDELLRGVAARLAGSGGPDDVVARLDGDAFAVLVRSPFDIDRCVVELAERTVRSFALPVLGRSRAARCQPQHRSRHEPPRADQRRGAAVGRQRRHVRREGRRQATLLDLHARDARLDRPPPRHAEVELERAIEQKELVVQYQPLVDLVTGKTISVEALVRWNHPRRGRIPPIEFIPLAEATGLIVPLGRYVLEEACTRVDERYPDVQVQVNLSAIELSSPTCWTRSAT